jgi:hypothetical protein
MDRINTEKTGASFFMVGIFNKINEWSQKMYTVN